MFLLRTSSVGIDIRPRRRSVIRKPYPCAILRCCPVAGDCWGKDRRASALWPAFCYWERPGHYTRIEGCILLVLNVVLEKWEHHRENRVQVEVLRGTGGAGSVPVRPRTTRREMLVLLVEPVKSNPHLAEIIAALGSKSGFPNFLDGRQQKSDQDADDCDDHQELDERESPGAESLLGRCA